MKFPHFIAGEKLLALLALAGALGSATWWWRQQPALRRLRSERTAPVLAGAVYARAALPPDAPPARSWTRPAAQSSGADWVYELFTPPTIYYHATARTFTVTPPVYPGDATNTPFGLELLAVKREPFRLQLVGYIGAADDYVAIFVSEQTPETLLARQGKRFAELGLALKTFEVRRVHRAGVDAQTCSEVAAIATLRDERSGEDITLDTRSPRLTDTPLAVLRVTADAKAKPRTLRVGDTFRQDDATFRIAQIRLDPPEVVVAREIAGLPFPEMRVLKPEVAGKSARLAIASRSHDQARPELAEVTRP